MRRDSIGQTTTILPFLQDKDESGKLNSTRQVPDLRSVLSITPKLSRSMNAMMMGSGAGDRTTFVGAIVPPLVKALPKLLKGLDLALFQRVLAGKSPCGCKANRKMG